MPFIFHRRLFIILGLAFIIATIVGTLSHEFGHYIVARSLGYKATIHYDRTGVEPGEMRSLKDRLWITLGGPIQTLATGIVGLMVLFARRRSFQAKTDLKPGQWLVVFIALFWLRQVANLIMWFGSYFFSKRFSYRGDEVRIATQTGLPFWSLTTITGILSIIILFIVVFRFIPIRQRVTFLLAGAVGGISGHVLWLILLGPVLLP